MKKKTVIAIICLLVLIVPTTIYAIKQVGCPGHVYEEYWTTERVGTCQYKDVQYKKCTKCDMPPTVIGGGNPYYNHKCVKHISLGPNTCLHYCKCGKYKYGAPSDHWYVYQN